MSNVNTVAVPTAVEGKHRLNLTYEHDTTSDFMRLQPVGYRHMPKDEDYTCNVVSTVNPLPIQLPVFGSVKQNVRAFFVPYRLVMPQWDSFYNDELASNYNNTSFVAGCPYIEMGDIVKFLLYKVGGVYRYVHEVNDSTAIANGEYDIGLGGLYFVFNELGRRMYSVLLSLGYVAFGGDKNTTRFNALAILALAKVYIDWYANPQYLNSTVVNRIRQLLAFNDPTSALHVTSADLMDIIEFSNLVCYDCDEYFNFAWDNPVSPNNNAFTQLTWADPSSNTSVIVNQQGTPQMQSSDSFIGTQTAHDFLRRISEYQRRHQVAGARSIDRMLLQFGIVSDALKLQRSIYVGSFVNDVKIGNLYATANGSNGQSTSSVGDYSGVGFGQASHSWNFKSDEDGIFLVLHTIVPSAGFFQGYDRNNRCLNMSEFYVPELDGSVQLIEKGEVYVSKDYAFEDNDAHYTTGFGFGSKYAEKKFPRNFITGDIRFFSGGNYADAWHLMRVLSDDLFSGSSVNLVHSNSFARGVDRQKYDRIFQYTGNVDHFICQFKFDAHAYSPLKPAFDTFDFESEKNKIRIQTNGTMVN